MSKAPATSASSPAPKACRGSFNSLCVILSNDLSHFLNRARRKSRPLFCVHRVRAAQRADPPSPRVPIWPKLTEVHRNLTPSLQIHKPSFSCILLPGAFRMSDAPRIPLLQRDSASPDAQKIYDALLAARGVVPNMFKILAYRPE